MSSTESTADGSQQVEMPEVPGSASQAVTVEAGTESAPAPADAALTDPTTDGPGAPDAPSTGDGPGAESPDAPGGSTSAPASPAAESPAPVSADPVSTSSDTEGTAPAHAEAAAESATTESASPASTPADATPAEAGAAEAATAEAIPTATASGEATPADAGAAEGVPTAGGATPADGATAPGAPARPGGQRKPRPSRGQRAAAQAQTPVVVPVVPPSDPTEWGRVDEEGTVYVRTNDGERPVGSWQAGEPAEGLAHYGRRFDDLATEIALLEARLAAHQGNPGELKGKAQALVDTIPTAAAVGDLLSLALRAQAIVTVADAAIAVSKVEKAEARAAAVARKEALAAEAEQIAADSTQWKASGDRLKAIVEEWKTIKGIDRKTDEALWKRFAAARDAFGRRRGAHFATLDVARNESRAAKKELIAEAERLSTSTEWGPTSAAMRSLMDRWKAVPRTGRETDDDLWKLFRAAQDVFFAARTASDKARDSEHGANQQAKEALLAEAEALDPSAKGSQNALRKIQERYDAIGHVPRDSIRRLEDRMQAVEEKFRGTADATRVRVAPENPMLTQMRAAVAKAEDQLAKAEAAGNAKRTEEARAALATRREWLAEAERAAGSRR